MDVAKPYTVIARGIEGDVLRVLSGTTDAMTGRQVHRMVGRASHRAVQMALGRLAREGLLDVREHGSAKLYSFNHEHLAAEPILALVGLRTRLIERLREQLAAWRPAPAYAALFGSTARGDGNSDSDIDVFIVRPGDVDADDPRWRQQIDELRSVLPRWTGNQAGISELSEVEVRDLLVEQPPILNDLRQHSIPLKGPRFTTWARRLA